MRTENVTIKGKDGRRVTINPKVAEKLVNGNPNFYSYE